MYGKWILNSFDLEQIVIEYIEMEKLRFGIDGNGIYGN